ncbi:MAG: DUF2865 domain-containing protein [Pseudaminobacter sp.]|nr:DUF2865 domain-containing protein [Pseudaminobacter sp.]
MPGGRKMRMRASGLFAALALFALAAGPALGETAICRQIRAELASASRGGSPGLERYDDAVARQRDELLKARRQAHDTGCGFRVSGSSVKRCASLNATMQRMESNLESLQRTRGQLAGSGRSRASLLAALGDNRCHEVTIPENLQGDPGLDGDRLLDEVFDERLEEDDLLDGENRMRRIIDGETGLREIGGYRTLCVRTCDGYFFPMSYQSSVRDFERDQKNCESRCPGADMQVFFHDRDAVRESGNLVAGDESAFMVSTATGRPYSELPTAYHYKQIGTPRPQGCGCNAAQEFEVIGGGSAGDAPAETSGSFVSPPVPEAKAAKIEPAGKAPPAADPPVAHAPDADRKVRVVGPKFLPDPAAAIDPQAPAPKQAP